MYLLLHSLCFEAGIYTRVSGQTRGLLSDLSWKVDHEWLRDDTKLQPNLG